MVLYECKICNYNTIRKNQYNRHLNTKKHLNTNSLKTNISCHETITKNCPLCNINFDKSNLLVKHLQDVHFKDTLNNNNCSSNYVCNFCKKTFKHQNSYYRHIKHYCKNKKTQSDIDYKDLMIVMVNKILDQTNDFNNKLLEEKDKSKNELLAEKDKINNLFFKVIQDNINQGGVNNIIHQNNTMNNSNYVLQFFNYSDADSMDFIKDKFKLSREEFIKASLTSGYKGALLEKAENIIIRPYLETQFKRPMHTVDSSRKKALYKDENNTKWTFNPKTTLTHCFETFHKSALEHQDKTIKDNPNLVIESSDDSLYKQTYFIPTENRIKESIFKEVQNHIHKETKVNRTNLIDFEDEFI